MSGLTKEELEELAALEADEKKRLDELAAGVKRQHLEALRLAKRLAAKHGVPGRDFLVLETKVGNIAVRRPQDVEIDKIEEDSDRTVLEGLATSIVLEPTAAELQALMAQHHGLVGAIVTQSAKMLGVMREEEAKK